MLRASNVLWMLTIASNRFSGCPCRTRMIHQAAVANFEFAENSVLVFACGEQLLTRFPEHQWPRNLLSKRLVPANDDAA